MKKNRVFIIIGTAVLLVAAVIFFTPYINVLSIQSRKIQPQRFYSTEGYSKGFVISYTHSVNKGRVHDFYRPAKNGGLELYKTEFVSYGAGIPEPEETPGAVFTVTDDGYFIENLNRYLPRLTMAVGLIANHSLAAGSDFYEQREYFLTSFFEPQTSIILEIKRISLFKYMRLSDPVRQ